MNIAVFCSGSDIIKDVYKEEAYKTTKLLAENGCNLVYGGGSHGLMGKSAEGFKAGGGKITGVSPVLFTTQEGVLFQCDEMIITNDLNDRKSTMNTMADGFLILPGGIGTLDELFTILSEKQLKYHDKPIVLLNTDGFYDDLVKFVTELNTKGFMADKTSDLFKVANNSQQALEFLKG